MDIAKDMKVWVWQGGWQTRNMHAWLVKNVFEKAEAIADAYGRARDDDESDVDPEVEAYKLRELFENSQEDYDVALGYECCDNPGNPVAILICNYLESEVRWTEIAEAILQGVPATGG